VKVDSVVKLKIMPLDAANTQKWRMQERCNPDGQPPDRSTSRTAASNASALMGLHVVRRLIKAHTVSDQ
jgi:hypothetical protein